MTDQATIDAARAAPLEPSATEGRATRTTTEANPPPAQENAPPPGTEQTPPAEVEPAESKPATPDPRDRAIRQLAFEQRETRRQLAAAREALERAAPARDPNAPPSQEELDRQVEQRAQALVASRENQAKSEAWIAKGNAEFEDFTARCNSLADLGAAENGSFLAAIGRIADGHKVIAELAGNPAEATRILALPPVDLAVELAGISHRIATAPPPPPKPTTQAPPPIRPITAAARAEVNLESLDGDAFRAAWNKRTRG